MKQAKWPYELQRLKKFSRTGELISISKTKEESRNQIRQIFFPSMRSRIARYYYSLTPEHQRIIGKVVDTLTENRQHQGFNLKVFLDWYEENGVKLMIIAGHFHRAQRGILDKNKRKREAPIDESMGRYTPNKAFSLEDMEKLREEDKEMSESIANQKEGVYGRIARLADTAKFTKQSDDLIQVIEDNLFVSRELFLHGRGEIYVVKEDILKLYMEDKFFSESVKNRLPSQPDGEKYLRLSIKEELTLFAEYIGKTWDEIIETEYAVINYSYGYFFLDKSPIKGARDLVDELIYDLYNEQMKGTELSPEIGREVFLAQLAKIKSENE